MEYFKSEVTFSLQRKISMTVLRVILKVLRLSLLYHVHHT